MKKESIFHRIRRKFQAILFRITSARFVSKLYYRLFMKKKLNLKNPVGFNEKIQWLKLYEYPFDDLVVKCTDKYDVREYIESKGLGSILNNLYFVCDKESDVDWNSLPNQFALKCTHGCGYNIICDDKEKIDLKKARKRVKRWMKEKFGEFFAEIHYNRLKPKIICEKFLGGDIVDYKFYCFGGVPKFLYMSKGLGNYEDAKIAFYNIDKSSADFGRTDFAKFDDASFPDQYEHMLEIARILAKDFLFVRVDLYEFEGKVYFGELTFTPAGGLMKFEPEEYEQYFGSLLDITKSKAYKAKNVSK